MDSSADPEGMIAALNRQRHVKVFVAVGGLIVALGVLLMASVAMYADEPEAAKPVPAVASQ